MTFTTKNKQNSGVIEMYILLPLFLGLTLLVGGIGFLLIHKTKMEKIAWTLQTQGTYRLKQDDSKPYKVKGRSIYQDAAEDAFLLQTGSAMGLSLFNNLPIAFRAWIAFYPNQRKTLLLDQDFPKIIQDFYLSSTLPGKKESERLSPGADLETGFVVMGHPLDNGLPWYEKVGLKYATWAEEMNDAGFDYTFLEFVGYKEIWEAASGSIPSAVLKELPGIKEIMDGVIPEMKGPNGTPLPVRIL